MSRRENTARQFSVPAETGDVLSTPELELHKVILGYYWDRRFGSLKHAPQSIKNSISSINRLIVFCGKPFWRWEKRDLDTWFSHLGKEDKLSKSTQRIQQSNIRTFLDFVVSEQGICNEVQQQFGVRPKQVVTKDICIRIYISN